MVALTPAAEVRTPAFPPVPPVALGRLHTNRRGARPDQVLRVEFAPAALPAAAGRTAAVSLPPALRAGTAHGALLWWALELLPPGGVHGAVPPSFPPSYPARQYLQPMGPRVIQMLLRVVLYIICDYPYKIY